MKVYVPPVKIQGIKTKIVEFISENICLEENTTWFEPFMGSGVVGLNLAPDKAVFSDTNPYVIELYNAIKEKKITSYDVRGFLEYEGSQLSEKGEEYYRFVRDRFNELHNPLDFLFLNRSCFNGLIRFNRQHQFNVPYGHKPERFAKAYVTKIVNQVKHLESIFADKDWVFLCDSFENVIVKAGENDFIYCDPPYIGRHVDYYDSWDVESEIQLRDLLFSTRAKFMLSTWDGNCYRKNEYIDSVWKGCYKLTMQHFYHIGAKEVNRNAMTEALLTNYNTDSVTNRIISGDAQISLDGLLATA